MPGYRIEIEFQGDDSQGAKRIFNRLINRAADDGAKITRCSVRQEGGYVISEFENVSCETIAIAVDIAQ